MNHRNKLQSSGHYCNVLLLRDKCLDVCVRLKDKYMQKGTIIIVLKSKIQEDKPCFGMLPSLLN